jgi:uncharacterized membrane protein
MELQHGNGGQRLAAGLGWFSIGLGLAELAAPDGVAGLIGLNNDNATRAILRGYGAREMANGAAILASGADDPGWLWARVAGDVVDLASLGAAPRRADRNAARLAFGIASVAGVLIADIAAARALGRSDAAATGRAPQRRRDRTIRVLKTFTINKGPDEVYAFWRQLENLPTFMTHLESVEVDGPRSRWTARGPGGLRVRWEAEMTQDSPRQIAWRSLPGADVPNHGTVRFEPAPGARGTELRVELVYEPPGGRAAALVAKLFGREPEQQLDEDLRRAKQLLEAGEIPTAGGRPGIRKPTESAHSMLTGGRI